MCIRDRVAAESLHAASRGEQMTGTRLLGLPSGSAGMERDRYTVSDTAPRDDHEALTGFASHRVNDN